ncbi:hypothetical protein Leryth_009973 [Lithospermum erythrorhizon]|nr:hypothetical protein Leryth_009973 [Lithospermum erythrorhizon]
MTYPCTCHQANEQGDKVVPVLPRKLKVNEEEIVKDYGKKDLAFEPLFNKNDVASSGNMETKEMHAMKGSQEELDEAKEAKYFTMDYRHVKKRRPIHNKSQPSSAASP